MTKLIDADAVYKILESCEIKKDTYGSLLNDWDHGYNSGIERAESEIECAPTVESVSVIRCKDCKTNPYNKPASADVVHGTPDRCWDLASRKNAFCSEAERKEE